MEKQPIEGHQEALPGQPHGSQEGYQQPPPPANGYQHPPPVTAGYQQTPLPPVGGYQQQAPPAGGYQQLPPPAGGYQYQPPPHAQQQQQGPPPAQPQQGWNNPQHHAPPPAYSQTNTTVVIQPTTAVRPINHHMFRESGVQIVCPYCSQTITTATRTTPGMITWVAVIIICLIG
ncbi:proline-rich protein 2-like [Saccostrea echinata]|uniref:proline-rich protein 2-like n=1 Tax=Saccostrea echinata TaxID=191078 RepID=UPI002A7FA461|nr:proline-rich protein 2-like [Saccostrea echinata]